MITIEQVVIPTPIAPDMVSNLKSNGTSKGSIITLKDKLLKGNRHSVSVMPPLTLGSKKRKISQSLKSKRNSCQPNLTHLAFSGATGNPVGNTVGNAVGGICNAVGGALGGAVRDAVAVGAGVSGGNGGTYETVKGLEK